MSAQRQAPASISRAVKIKPERCLARWLYRVRRNVVAVVGVAALIQGSGVSIANAEEVAATGRDFIAEARVVYRVAACAGLDPVPAGIRKSVVDHHCKAFKPRLRAYVRQYLGAMQPFLARHLPTKLPSTVIYPFGGADLVTALMTYPEASEIYTLSLEHAGDIRNVDQLGTLEASRELSAVREVTARLLGLETNDLQTINTNGELMAIQDTALKNPIALFLIALAIHDLEPVSLRYLVLDENGSIRYLGADDFERLDSIQAKALSDTWQAPTFSSAFSSYELRFKPVNQAGPIRVHRHIAANLANAHFKQDSAVFRHLMGKGHVAAITKGALNLLWEDEFSNVREFLIKRADPIVSDCSGVSPLHGVPAGLAYTTFGRYEGLISREQDKEYEQALIEAFNSQSYRPIPARYGYADRRSNSSMLIIRRETSTQ